MLKTELSVYSAIAGMAWHREGHASMWVNKDYDVDQVSGGHWSIASLGVARVAPAIKRLRPAAGDCQWIMYTYH